MWPDIRVGSNIILHHITRPKLDGWCYHGSLLQPYIWEEINWKIFMIHIYIHQALNLRGCSHLISIVSVVFLVIFLLLCK